MSDTVEKLMLEYNQQNKSYDLSSGDLLCWLKYYSRYNGVVEGRYYKHHRETSMEIRGSVRTKLEEDSNIDFNLKTFLNAKATMADKEGVYYSWITDLPCEKIILLSATANGKVYTEFCQRLCAFLPCKNTYDQRHLSMPQSVGVITHTD